MKPQLDKNYQRNVLQRWKPVLEAGGKKITNPHVALSTALVLENTQEEFKQKGLIKESYGSTPSVPAASSFGGMAAQPGTNLVPDGGHALGSTTDYGVNDSRIPTIVIPTLRRVYPELLAHEIMGVQPMNGPVGFAYAIRHQYGVNRNGDAGNLDGQGTEIGYNTIYSDFTGASGLTELDRSGNYAADVNGQPLSPVRSSNDYWQAFAGVGAGGIDNDDNFNGMGATLADSEWWKIGEDMPMAQFKIEKGIVEARTRKLGAHWSRELGEDMMNMHGIDVDAEMVNVLSYEIAAEIDRQSISEQVKAALNGTLGQHFSLWTPVSADGRHQQERLGTLYTQVLIASQRIATNTRRSHANYAIADSTVTAFLERMSDYSLDAAGVAVDGESVGVTRVGTLRQGSIKLFRDTFGGDFANGNGYILLGYKGKTPYDAGIVYCPYIPLQLMRENGETDFTPRIGVRTRYGMLNNLYGAANYYHFIKVEGLNSSALLPDGSRVFAF
jgi:hypothetical protein